MLADLDERTIIWMSEAQEAQYAALSSAGDDQGLERLFTSILKDAGHSNALTTDHYPNDRPVHRIEIRGKGYPPQWRPEGSPPYGGTGKRGFSAAIFFEEIKNA